MINAYFASIVETVLRVHERRESARRESGLLRLLRCVEVRGLLWSGSGCLGSISIELLVWPECRRLVRSFYGYSGDGGGWRRVHSGALHFGALRGDDVRRGGVECGRRRRRVVQHAHSARLALDAHQLRLAAPDEHVARLAPRVRQRHHTRHLPLVLLVFLHQLLVHQTCTKAKYSPL